MLSLRYGRVARRLRILTELARSKVRNRQNLRENAAALETIQEAVTRAGIDPATNAGLRHYGGADRALARSGDSAELRRADADFIAPDPQLAKRASWPAQAAARAARFVGRPPPAPGAGSPFDWYAWSLAFLSGTAPA